MFTPPACAGVAGVAGSFFVGTWLSLVEHSLGVRGVGSSNLPVPTIHCFNGLPATRSRLQIIGEYSIEGKEKGPMFTSLHCNFAYSALACLRMGNIGIGVFP